jgi:hypothetical protein
MDSFIAYGVRSFLGNSISIVEESVGIKKICGPVFYQIFQPVSRDMKDETGFDSVC